MLRQLASRNQRSNGILVLQICVLLVVCFWLVYQIKHSRDQMDENEAIKSLTVTSTSEIFKYGRKEFLHLHVDVEEEMGSGIKQVKDNKIDVEEKQDEEKEEEQKIDEGEEEGEDKIIDSEIENENEEKHENHIEDKEENPNDEASVLEEEDGFSLNSTASLYNREKQR